MTTQFIYRSTIKRITLLTGMMMFALIPAQYVYGQEQPQAQTPCPCPCPPAQTVSDIPQTAQEHLALAESYRKRAADYRAEAEMHRKMMADYKKGVAITPKEHSENSWLKKMRLHCEKYIGEAESLAQEADKFADYHMLRAKELEGK